MSRPWRYMIQLEPIIETFLFPRELVIHDIFSDRGHLCDWARFLVELASDVGGLATCIFQEAETNPVKFGVWLFPIDLGVDLLGGRQTGLGGNPLSP